jgi:hypothetical protein
LSSKRGRKSKQKKIKVISHAISWIFADFVKGPFEKGTERNGEGTKSVGRPSEGGCAKSRSILEIYRGEFTQESVSCSEGQTDN